MPEKEIEKYDEIEDEFGIEDLDEEKEEDKISTAFPQEKKGFTSSMLGIIMITILAIVGLVYYAAIWLPNNKAQQMARQAVANISQTESVNAEPAMLIGLTLVTTSVSNELTESPDLSTPATKAYETTPVQAMDSPTVDLNDEENLDLLRTATVAALLTEAANISQPTINPHTEQPEQTIIPTIPITPIAKLPTVLVTPVATALPKTGWMDEVGMPLMIGLALGLISLIILIRVIRASRAAS